MVTIYVLLEDRHIRFIGKTKLTDLDERLDQHLKEADSNPEKYGWITNLSKKGKKPEIKAVFTYDEADADYYEHIFINDYRHFLGVKLNDGIKDPLSIADVPQSHLISKDMIFAN